MSGAVVAYCERWLVTGATGLLGTAVCSAAADRGIPTIGLSRTGGPFSLQHDLSSPQQIPQLLDRLQPDGVLHLAAMARPTAVERDPAAAERVNVDATRAIAEWCADNTRRLVFASSDWVFAGDQGPHREVDTPQPRTRYGRFKLAGERACIAAGGTVARLGWILDDRPIARGDFIWSGLERLRRGERVTAVDNELRTPISRSRAAKYLLEIARAPHAGVVHVAGHEHVTPYGLLHRLAQSQDLPTHLIQRGSSADLAPPDRPRDVRLDTSLLRRLFPPAGVVSPSALQTVA